jgi:hypothetical protein
MEPMYHRFRSFSGSFGSLGAGYASSGGGRGTGGTLTYADGDGTGRGCLSTPKKNLIFKSVWLVQIKYEEQVTTPPDHCAKELQQSCNRAATVLQQCCNSAATEQVITPPLPTTVSPPALLRVPQHGLPPTRASATRSSVAALLQLCCSSVAALLQLCVDPELCAPTRASHLSPPPSDTTTTPTAELPHPTCRPHTFRLNRQKEYSVSRTLRNQGGKNSVTANS